MGCRALRGNGRNKILSHSYSGAIEGAQLQPNLNGKKVKITLSCPHTGKT